MRGVRVGAIGARPAGFNTVRYSEKLLERLGIAVETLDLSEVFTRIKCLRDDDIRVDEKRRLLLDNADASAIPADKLVTMAKLFVVISEWVIANDIDTTAIQCWTSLQENLGINVCSIMSVMSGQLMPSACEVDVMGALSMYALASSNLSPASIADWNNNFGDDRDKCVLFTAETLHQPVWRAPKWAQRTSSVPPLGREHLRCSTWTHEKRHTDLFPPEHRRFNR